MEGKIVPRKGEKFVLYTHPLMAVGLEVAENEGVLTLRLTYPSKNAVLEGKCLLHAKITGGVSPACEVPSSEEKSKEKLQQLNRELENLGHHLCGEWSVTLHNTVKGEMRSKLSKFIVKVEKSQIEPYFEMRILPAEKTFTKDKDLIHTVYYECAVLVTYRLPTQETMNVQDLLRELEKAGRVTLLNVCKEKMEAKIVNIFKSVMGVPKMWGVSFDVKVRALFVETRELQGEGRRELKSVYIESKPFPLKELVGRENILRDFSETMDLESAIYRVVNLPRDIEVPDLFSPDAAEKIMDWLQELKKMGRLGETM